MAAYIVLGAVVIFGSENFLRCTVFKQGYTHSEMNITDQVSLYDLAGNGIKEKVNFHI